MSLQFVLGSSGSGKTEYIYRQIVEQAGKHPKQNFLVIVPEQFTMSTQQKLVELAPNHAIMNIDVLSFKRLAYRVFGCWRRPARIWFLRSWREGKRNILPCFDRI